MNEGSASSSDARDDDSGNSSMNTSKLVEVLKAMNYVFLASDNLSVATSGDEKVVKGAKYSHKVRTSHYQKKPRFGENILILKFINRFF